MKDHRYQNQIKLTNYLTTFFIYQYKIDIYIYKIPFLTF